MVVGALLLSVAITALAWGGARWLPSLVPPWGGSFAVPAALALAQVPAFFVSQANLRRKSARGFAAAFWAQSILQLLWIQWTCWESVPHLWVLGLMMVTSWMFYDTWLLPRGPAGWMYGMMFPAFDLSLLVADALGSNGLLAAWHARRESVLGLLAMQVLIAGLMQMFRGALIEQAAAYDAALLARRSLEEQLVLARREREIVQRSATFLATGITASKFSHDVASPVTVIRVTVEAIGDMLAAAPAAVPRDWLRRMREAFTDVDEGAAQVAQMTGALAMSLRAGEVPAACAVERLVGDVTTFFERAMRGHRVDAAPPAVSLAPGEVWVTPGHASSIGNLLVNGALQAPGEPTQLSGACVGPWFYVLRVRDRGVSGARRDQALETIAAMLGTLDADSTPRFSSPGTRAGSYRGFGIGLMLVKIHLMRHNGAISVVAAEGEVGLEFRLALPRVNPARIPEAENQPERLLESLDPPSGDRLRLEPSLAG